MEWHSVLHVKLDEAFAWRSLYIAALDEEYERSMAALAKKLDDLVVTRS